MTIESPAADASPLAIELHAADAAASMFHGLADPSRTLIVHHLMSGEHNVKSLTEHLGLAQATVSGHLARLVDCGLVTRRAEGRSVYYGLAHPELTMSLLRATEELLAASGEAVVLCPRHGIDAE